MKTYHPLRNSPSPAPRVSAGAGGRILDVRVPAHAGCGPGNRLPDRPIEIVRVDVQQAERAQDVVAQLSSRNDVVVALHGEAECRERLRTGSRRWSWCRATRSPSCSTPAGRKARSRAPASTTSCSARPGGHDPVGRPMPRDRTRLPVHRFPGPGLLGMNLMGGSMWGVGFAIVDMRVKKLLKRLAATPMTRTNFLWSLAGSRLLFNASGSRRDLGYGMLLFGMPIRGSWMAILTLAILGAVSFAASACSRVPGAAHRNRLGPDELHSWCRCGCCRHLLFVGAVSGPSPTAGQALPLTQLNDALRAVILEALRSHPKAGGFLGWWPGERCHSRSRCAGSAGTRETISYAAARRPELAGGEARRVR